MEQKVKVENKVMVATKLSVPVATALKHAAVDDLRPVSLFLEKIISDWLRDHDYIK